MTIIAFAVDQWGWSRGESVAINGVLLIVLSLPCVLIVIVLIMGWVPVVSVWLG